MSLNINQFPPPGRINKNCVMHHGLGVNLYKRCTFCDIKYPNCLGTQYNVIAMSVILLMLVTPILPALFIKFAILINIVLILVLGGLVNSNTDALVISRFNLQEENLKNQALSRELKQYSVQLETQVLERTKELADKNSQLEIQNRKVQEADRHKSQFLANMSHELRTPLNSIIGFSKVILNGIDGPISDQQRADLGAIHANGNHLLGLINDILDLSKIASGKMELHLEPLRLEPLIEEAMAMAGSLVGDKPITLSNDVAKEIPPVRADATRVRQIILNLLSNAVKFTEQGHVILSVHADADEIDLSISDTGVGVSPEDHEKIFQEFEQVDNPQSRKKGGTGLGLAICKKLVEMHGGRIWVTSRLGTGSTFHFTLPVVRDRVASLDAEPLRSAPVTTE